MNTNATASIHIKPCNIAQSDEHNRRDEQYLKALNPANIYIRKDLTCLNSTYVPSDMKGTSLQEYYDSLKAMVKAKAQGETTKVTIRNARRDGIDTLKKAQKNEGLSEDGEKEGEDELQKVTDKYVKNVDAVIAAKEKEILTV